MKFLVGDYRHHPWAAKLGWDRGLTHRVFAGKQLPSPEALIKLATAERVNLTWILTGEGPPYQVLPPPEPQSMVFGSSIKYYLFGPPDCVQPPLIFVRTEAVVSDIGPSWPMRYITVYDGSPVDLLRAVEWVARRGRPIHIVEDGADAAARLRSGRAGNRLLFDEGKGLLERALPVLPTPRMAVSALVEDRRAGYWAGASTLNEEEREWVMRYRELADDQRAALLLIARGMTRRERGT